MLVLVVNISGLNILQSRYTSVYHGVQFVLLVYSDIYMGKKYVQGGACYSCYRAVRAQKKHPFILQQGKKKVVMLYYLYIIYPFK